MPALSPTYSIIIPTRNRAQMVCRCIDSVRNQTYNQWECLVVDDHSTDNTYDVVRRYSQEDSRIKYLHNDRMPGAQGARNTGIRQACGQWVLLLDSDNAIELNYLAKISQYGITHPNVDVITNYIRVIQPDGSETHTQWKTDGNILYDLLCGKIYVDNSSACVRKTILDKIGLLDERCPSYQEWDTHIRIAQIGEYGCIEEYLTQYHEHTKERVSRRNDTVWAHGLYVLRKHRKLWQKTAGKDIYTRMLLQVYEERKSLSMPRQLLVTFIVVWLSPKLGKQLVKRKNKCLPLFP